MISHPIERRRSVAFLEREGTSWACFLVTWCDGRGWQGHLSFRPGPGASDEDEVRTADIFVEEDEQSIDEKARGMGRPLLLALLDSALHTRGRRSREGIELRARLRSILSESAVGVAGGRPGEPWGDDGVDRLESLYASYRIDQVCHLICLVAPTDFEETVQAILGDTPVDFGGMDRVQLAMVVVDRIEGLLPLPDFETWVRDFLRHPETYRLYAHRLHRAEGLPDQSDVPR